MVAGPLRREPQVQKMVGRHGCQSDLLQHGRLMPGICVPRMVSPRAQTFHMAALAL
jgi:hypothetical protein